MEENGKKEQLRIAGATYYIPDARQDYTITWLQAVLDDLELHNFILSGNCCKPDMVMTMR